MIIFQKSLKVPVQASLVEDDHVIQAFAADRTDHTFAATVNVAPKALV